MRRPSLVSLLLTLALAACEGAPPDDQAVYDAMPRLSLSPVVEICAGSEDVQCQFVNAMLVTAAPDGRVAVADMMGELREFDREGRFVRTVGARGGGPGEYRRLVAAGYDEQGRLTVLDQAAMRVQRFDTAGAVSDATTAPMIPGLMGVSVVGGQVALFALPGATAVGDSVEVHVVLVDPSTGDTTSLPGLPEPAMATGDGSVFAMPPLFTVMPLERWGVSPDGALLLADGERLRIVRRGAGDEAPRVLVDLGAAPYPVTAGELEAEKARRLEEATRMGGGSPTLQRTLDEAAASAPKTHPFVSRLVVLDDGTVFAREGVRPGADSVRWNAFTADGDPVGHLLLPADARIASGRFERLLVVTAGEHDVPRIIWFAVEGGATPSRKG
ncbi:MAG TPA: 6-bladed beta-propeller [Gemmatimonadales bacterium]